MGLVSVFNILHKDISVNSIVTVNGWVRSRRDSKAGLSFIDVYDGSCLALLQVVVYATLSNYYSEVLRITAGCAVKVTGRVIKSLGDKQFLEIRAELVTVLGWVVNPDTYPISSKKHSLEYLREFAHLRPRTNIIGAVTRIRHNLMQAIHRYMHTHGFYWISTPLITSFDTEGSSKMFRVSTLDLEHLPRTKQGNVNYKKDFFGKESFLTVSGQLSGESYACALSKIYTFGPIFRAEKSNTSRHLAEFWMLEPEMAFADLREIVILSISLLKFIFKIILSECIDDINFFAERIDKDVISRLERFINQDCTIIDYSEAVSILKKDNKNFKVPVFWGKDLASEHERYLTEKYFMSPLVVLNYPKDIKAFYMRVNDDQQTVASMDVLMPKVGEIIGGSQREERMHMLDKRFEELNINKDNYWWYRDLRRYGTVPHSGFGLGFERLVTYVTGMQNIRDVIPFPRYPHSVNF